jgi:GxxExxY protein
MDLIECDDSTVDKVLTAATNVHQELGPGLLETVYEQALALELATVGLKLERQYPVPVKYRGKELGVGFKVDFLVENSLVLELKSVDELSKAHTAQLINYLRLLKIKRGFLINFNRPLLKQGIKRVSI